MNLANLSRTASGDHRGTGIENYSGAWFGAYILWNRVISFLSYTEHRSLYVCQEQKVVSKIKTSRTFRERGPVMWFGLTPKWHGCFLGHTTPFNTVGLKSASSFLLSCFQTDKQNSNWSKNRTSLSKHVCINRLERMTDNCPLFRCFLWMRRDMADVASKRTADTVDRRDDGWDLVWEPEGCRFTSQIGQTTECKVVLWEVSVRLLGLLSKGVHVGDD